MDWTPNVCSFLGNLLIRFFDWFAKRRRKRQLGLARIVSIPRYGYQEVGTGIYGGVKWVLRLPNPEPFPLYPPDASEIAKKLKVEGPLCPKCDTELEENKRLFRYYLTCVKCGFRIKKKMPVYKLREQAYRFFQPDVRKHLQKQMKKQG